ncbi:mismatch-specific DNA-glycosylase [Gordonia sp. ABSL1-1]|uniref:mismatch-specific DNA-glycosylase n=1 Tax=Gordonia sp. ABSL1-1 TaxID=3053923 RepID=UPI002572C2DE|nr:mismatch-specific DNA-glycosylase [Gordonia sp. ABSL1-1]MDL9937240.1 mismatch-specific DNA-glycosylase [Gordonia sp. ABSL1-1]
MGFTRAQLQAYAGTTVDDLVDDRCRLLFVGINPGLWTAATGAHFARPGNRFYPALAAAGIVDKVIDASSGLTDADRDLLLDRGIGMTNVVARASATAAELSADELRSGGKQLRERIRQISPAVVAVAGITAYRIAFGDRAAKPGRQKGDWDGAQVWVVPNPSGLNAHETVATLGASYREVAQAAGLNIA